MSRKKISKKQIKTTKANIKKLLEQKIKPAIQMDGGDIEMIDYDNKENIVKIKLLGACVGCPLSGITLKMGVEKEIKNNFPDVKEVIALE